MALSKTGLQARIKTKMDSYLPIPGDLPSAQRATLESSRDTFARAIAEAIVDELTANAVVSMPGVIVETYAAGTGDHGGALAAGIYPVAGSVKSTTQTGTIS